MLFFRSPSYIHPGRILPGCSPIGSVVLIACRLGCLLVSCCILSLSTTAIAQDAGRSKAGQVRIELGFDGAWKLGQTCPVRVQIDVAIAAQAKVIELQTVDGDGVEVTYRRALAGDEAALAAAEGLWVPIRIGRADAKVQVRILGDEDELIADGELSAGDSRQLPSDQTLVLTIGSSMGIETLVRSNADGSASNFAIAEITNAMQLPNHWSDLSSLDLILISSADASLLSSISEEQWSAIDRWIRRGGGCIFSLGPTALASMDLSEKQVLKQLIPGDVAGDGQVSDPRVLESLVNTSVPLRAFPVTMVENPRGSVELALTDVLSRAVPWWITEAHGHGTVRFIASDLDHPSFATWKDRGLVWEKLLEPYFDAAVLDGSVADQATADMSYLGYSDLVGQLRASLEQFASVRVISFGQVVAVLLGILVLIGPVDYFISVRWLRRPEFSWYFAGASLVAISAGLIWFYGVLRPDGIRVNSAQVVDIDTRDGTASGWLWSHVYSGQAHTVNITATSNDATARQVALDWQGLPGSGLGGLSSQLSADRGMPPYDIAVNSDGASRIESIGIPSAGTTCVTGSWVGDFELSGKSTLEEIPGVYQLSGELVNPLSVDLRDTMVFYHNWYYRLNSRIPPGGAIQISFDTIPKDIARRLNGRRNVEGDELNTRWDPADRDSIDRVLEMMMFHRAATGSNYTSLAHRYQPIVDHSNLLDTDLAILVGRIDTPPVSIQVETTDGSSPETTQEADRVWCRILIPVSKTPSERN